MPGIHSHVALRTIVSLFPGIGILDKGFEDEGFCVLRGPDLIWGGDIRRFHLPPEVCQGIIGGPPCQDFSSLNRSPNRLWCNHAQPIRTSCVTSPA